MGKEARIQEKPTKSQIPKKLGMVNTASEYSHQTFSYDINRVKVDVDLLLVSSDLIMSSQAAADGRRIHETAPQEG